MTPEQRWLAERRAQAARLPRLQRAAVSEVLRQLRDARVRILRELGGTNLTGARRAQLTKVRASVEAALTRWAGSAGRTLEQALRDAAAAGVAQLTAPGAAAGIGMVAPRINDRLLAAQTVTLTRKIKDVSVQTVNRINAVIGDVVLGVTPMSDAITRVERILRGSPRSRAAMIVYTEVGRVHSAALQAAMEANAERIPALKKRWLRSGKIHPRPDHFRAHNQVVDVAKPFVISDTPIMYPRDPKAPPGHTINCGCQMVPELPGSAFGAGVVTGFDADGQRIVVSREERERDNQRVIDQARERMRRLGLGAVDLPPTPTEIHSADETRLLDGRL